MQLVHSRESAFSGVMLSPAEQDDVQLARASQRGDQEAFTRLVRRYQRRIFNLSLSMLNDEDDASESTQEAFVAAWQRLPGFHDEAHFSTWFYRIAYQCGLRQLKRRKREHTRHSAAQAEQTLTERHPEKQEAGTTRRHDLPTLVHEYLEDLPLTYRIVFILRHLHDKTYEEIAAILNIPIATVKTQLFRTRALLKERLASTAPLVTREPMAETPRTENEEVMHPPEPFPLHARGQESTADNQETDDFSQHQQAWLEQQRGWLEQQYSALTQQEAWLEQRRGWLDQQQGWIEQRRGWVVEQRSWIEQQRGWLTQREDKSTHQAAWLTQQAVWLDQQYTTLVQQYSEVVQQHQWVQQRRCWLDRQKLRLTQQESALIQGEKEGKRLSG